jgi:chromosome segregation ATPase
MEQDEILRKLTKYESAQQKGQSKIVVIQKQITALENAAAENHSVIDKLSEEITQIRTLMKRFDRLDESLVKIRSDLSKAIENIEKQRADHDREVEKIRLADIGILNKAVLDFRGATKNVKELEERFGKDSDYERIFFQLEKHVNNFSLIKEENQRNIKVIEEALRQNTKKIASLQNEVLRIHKKSDEHTGQIDLMIENVRKLESRFNEFQQGEVDRQQIFSSSMENLKLLNIERDRLWKEWESRFETMNTYSRTFEEDTTILMQNFKNAQSFFEQMNQRLDRRLNEVSEMQRLTDERIRQEWQGFKSDDQKRWTTYLVGQEELQRELNRQMDKNQARIIGLEDLTQEVKEKMGLMADENKKMYQKLIDFSNEWLETNERTFGRHK